MKYLEFTIKNYKGIKELKLELGKQPKTKIFTLVGLNESGKTSILEAIDLFQKDIAETKRHTLIPKGEKISFTNEIVIESKIELSEGDNLLIEQFAEGIGYRYIESFKSVVIRKRYIFNNSEFEEKKTTWYYVPKVQKKKSKKVEDLSGPDWQKLIDYISINLLPKIVYYPNFLFDFPEKIYIDEKANESTEESTYKNAIQDILSSIRDDLTIDEQLLNRMKTTNRSNNEALENTLSRMSAIVTQLVFAAWEKLFSRGNKAIEISHSSETAQIIAQGINKEITRYYLEFKLREGANKFYIHERSLGFKWFFAFLLFTEFRKYRSSNAGNVLFLLDEPASNLHSTAQKKLLETFQGLVDRSTLIYTTHSHHLINPEWLSGAYIVRNKALKDINEFDYNVNLTDVEAVPYRQFVSKNPEQKDYFQPILDILDYQPGLLEKIPNIITTEGKNDFYTLRYINQIYFSNKYKDLHFYPCTGADTNTPIISLYIAWARPLIVLLDGDTKGEKARISYLNKFGKLIEGNVYNLYNINESFKGLTLEGLFSEDERLFITKEFDEKLTTYDKGKFNSSIQTLLFENRKIDLSQSTIKNFENVFDFLSKKLFSN